ncbi:diguanylate cyclase domain-containing protein [Shewanella waksmanii]|uniref:diguanylate cyclase domain-containing protein n=1 Tax=Shewanella waksmanii TaxID=213783 RepID=UPI003735C727
MGRWRWALLIVWLLIGFSITALMASWVYDKETRAITIEFQQDVDDKAAALEREVLLNVEVLYALKGLFESSDNVTAAEFNKIAAPYLLRHQDIDFLQWASKTSGGGQEHYPVTYLASLASDNELITGYDLLSHSAYANAISQAVDLDQVVASLSKLTNSSKLGIKVFIPAYRGEPVDTPSRRAQNFGVAALSLKVDEMFNRAVQRTASKGIHFTLKDHTNPLVETLLTLHLGDEHGGHGVESFEYQRQLTPFAQRRWSLIARPSFEYIAGHRSELPYVVGICGSLFVLLAAGYYVTMRRRTELVEQEVQQRTLDLYKAKRQLELLSQTDGLTGLANRRHFEQRYETVWNEAIQSKRCITLMMLDVDHFKSFNDTYGHLEGDKCLKRVAQTIEQSLNRKSDFIARYGGEEFVLLLPHTRDNSIPAQRCLEAVEALQIPHSAAITSDFVTVSIGVAAMIPTTANHIEDLIALADAALYQAKENGRNGIHYHVPPAPDLVEQGVA